jgi:uncharacterized iron-regulated membrane protein
MGETPTTDRPPQQTARPVSYARVIVMLLVGGAILAVGGCALFLAYLNINGGSSSRDSISAAGAIIFIAGCLAFLVGIIWAFARWVDRRFAKAGKK